MDENLEKKNNKEASRDLRKTPLAVLKENEIANRSGKLKKNKRKTSDPVVKTVIELLLNKLTLESPKNSLICNENGDSSKNIDVETPKQTEKELNEKGSNQDSLRQTEINVINTISNMVEDLEKCGDAEDSKKNGTKPKDTRVGELVMKSSEKVIVDNPEKVVRVMEINSEEVTETSKINAFAMMMGNRNRSIGRNSPGKSIETPEVIANKSVIAVRKKLLENWAEAKGASKRKREYDEIGNCINEKLEKRAKKLKNMLKIENQDKIVIKKKRKRSISDSVSKDSFEEKKKERKTKSNSLKSWKIKLALKNEDEVATVEAITEDSANGINSSIVKENKRESINEEEFGKFSNENANLEETIEIDQTNDSVIIVDLVEENRIDDHAEIKSNNQTVGDCQENRRVLRTRKPRIIVSSDDDYEPPKTSKGKKDVKMAPVFIKSTPKLKEDPKIVEARRQFLLSGVPSSLKVVKPSSQEEIEFDVFPTVSHVQQKTENNIFWNLPKIDLKLLHLPNFEPNISNFINDSLIKTENINKDKNCDKISSLEKVNCMKTIIRGIKAENSNYPVYKVFKTLYEKSGNKQNKILTKRRGRKKKNPETVEEIAQPALMWTEKYKASCSGDILGNTNKIASLKTWLENFGKKSYYDSESDFEDGSSRDSSRNSWNAMILIGPSGSGKSMAVYAICNELNYNVLEVNASSKRTGKKVLQDLQEATRSHQVRKNSDFIKETPEDLKLCVLLVEDVDIVFEQDEGFFPALAQIAATSKRPIIFTTTDPNVINEQKFLNHFDTIKFSLPNHQIIGVWLQIVCLIEGIYVELESIQQLLEVNKNDVRTALLQLQFWVMSGGQFGEKPEGKCEQIETNHSDDSNLSIDDIDTTYKIHNGNFDNSLVDLEKFWWDLPRISDCKSQELQDLSTLYDSLALSDAVCGKTYQYGDLQPRWRSKLKDSLVLDENNLSDRPNDFGLELQNFLINESLLQYTKKCGQSNSKGTSGPIPNKLRSKLNRGEDVLREALQPLNCTERCSVILDYLPTLRTIARSELDRASTNQKRGNRFNNYLNSLGVSSRESSYKLLCNVFESENARF